MNGALLNWLPRTVIESTGPNVMTAIGQRFIDIGYGDTWNHTYLVTVVDKGDSNRRLTFIMDFQYETTDSHVVLTQTILSYYASNVIGTIAINGGTGQGFYFYATILV